jgi:4-hydroxyacetophenone monooxygenase
MRAMLVDYLTEQFGDRPDLLEKVIPQYPPASKRIVVDNGIWARTLKRDNVSLVTDRIASIEENGVRDVEGVLREVDIIIYATGFQPSKFLMPMEVVGLNGVELQREWKGDARAFMGVTVPKFPNFFILYGPNTNIVVNGSIIYFTECEVTYVMRYVEHLLRNNLKALDVKQEVHNAYNERVDQGNAGMVWGVATVNSWYRNEYNRVAQNWPFSLLEYWQQVQEIKPEQYNALS